MFSFNVGYFDQAQQNLTILVSLERAFYVY